MASASEDVSELAYSAQRKINHRDGKGCMADLQQIATLDPRTFERMAPTRAQCEMLVGKCLEGKERLIAWQVDHMNHSHDLAQRTADSYAAMYCRGGNATERDELRAALHDLQDGAFMSRKSSRWCAERIKTVRRLAPRVKPRDADDTQLLDVERSLWSMGPRCHARAGDCRAALTAHRQLKPRSAQPTGLTPAQREESDNSIFDAMVPSCKGTRRASGTRP